MIDGLIRSYGRVAGYCWSSHTMLTQNHSQLLDNWIYALRANSRLIEAATITSNDRNTIE